MEFYRPVMAEQAYIALSLGKEIEVKNDQVFKFLRFIELYHKGNLSIDVKVNEHHTGWSYLKAKEQLPY